MVGIAYQNNHDLDQPDIVSSIFTKNNFDDDLPEIKRFVGNPKPMSFTNN